MGAHLGVLAAALVDGELDHATRERAQRHLLDCAACRAEVEAQRRLKASLSSLATAPAPPPDLAQRLLALQVPGADRAHRGPLRPASPVGLRARPHRRRRLRRSATVGGGFAALGLVALALGGQPSGPSPRVDPATDSFVVQHVDTTSEVPRAVRATLTGGRAAR